MKPTYTPNVWDKRHDALKWLMEEIDWIRVRDARAEYFMAEKPTVYTYGTPPFEQTYASGVWHPYVRGAMGYLNSKGNSYNVCFLNRYDDEHNALGWHADDSPGMLHEHPIAVVSFGEPREIWVRENGAKGQVPPENRYVLGHGSLFEMPPGFQRSHQHRIPKGTHKMGPRVSLTFRRYVP